MKAWFFLLLALPAHAAPTNEPITRAMHDELARSMDKLALPGLAKPYYLAYELWDGHRVHADASLGAIIATADAPSRTIGIDLRVGDYTFDDSNTSGDRRLTVTPPLDDSYDVTRHQLWLATDSAYKRAVERLERKKAVAKHETKNADEADAFSKEPPSQITDEPALATPELAKVEGLAKAMSAVFRSNPDVYTGTVQITAATGHHYFVSSEGGSSVQPWASVMIDVQCRTQADDGTPLHDGITIWALTLDQLPPEAELVAQVQKLSAELSAIRKAPLVEDYGGPVLFTGIAAGQVMRGLLADNLEGTPAPKSDRPGQRESGDSELVGKVGARILPKDVSVVDDPTITRLGKQLLVSGQRFDDEGVPAQRVSLVEHGRLQRFLMSRTPRKGFPHSNGHGAGSSAGGVRAHPLNLIIASAAGVGDAEMRRRALAVARDEDLKYILVVDKLDPGGGEENSDPSMMSNDGLALPKPAVMRRVYLDGHEELVRGGTFAAMPVRTLKDIVAVGATPTVYSYPGYGMPARYELLAGNRGGYSYTVSLACPPLLFRDVDVKRPTGAQKQPPIAPRP